MTATIRNGQGGQQAADDLSSLMINWMQCYGPAGLFKSCGNCRHMTEGNAPAHCNLYDIIPPARIILEGCPSHEDILEVPF